MTLDEQDGLKKTIDFHLEQYEQLKKFETKNVVWSNTEILRLSGIIDKLEHKIEEYKNHDKQMANLCQELKAQDGVIKMGQAVADILHYSMMKELVKLDYYECEPINIGGTGVIFKIYSKQKGTNILKIDCKDQACMENEIKMHDKLNSIFFPEWKKKQRKSLMFPLHTFKQNFLNHVAFIAPFYEQSLDDVLELGIMNEDWAREITKTLCQGYSFMHSC